MVGGELMRAFFVAAIAVTALLSATPQAHHSFAATYLEDKSVTIEGEIVQFLLRSPHSFVHVMVTQPDGTKVRYVVEWGSPAQLSGRVSRDTLKAGDKVVISGNPGRNASDHRVRLLTFKRPADGWSWGMLADEKFD